MDKVAGTYQTWTYEWSGSDAVARHDKALSFLSSIEYFYPDSFLDIGCGNGTLTKRIMSHYGIDKAYGVDKEYIETKDIPEGLVISKCDTDLEVLPYKDNSFDLVHLGETFEHLFSPDKCLKEIYRVLKPNGLCFISTPNLGSWESRIAFLFGYHPYAISVSTEHEELGKFGLKPGFHGQWGHIRVPTLRALKLLLEVHRLKVVKVKGWAAGRAGSHVKGTAMSKLIDLTDSCISSISPSLSSRLAVLVKKV